MNTPDIFAIMESGLLHLPASARKNQDAPWRPHPVFAGVAMRDLVSAQDSQGGFSVHMVQVAPGCQLGEHNHPSQWEMHQVLAGKGVGRAGERVMAYEPGNIALIPAGENHGVQANQEGLALLAVFIPALS